MLKTVNIGAAKTTRHTLWRRSAAWLGGSAAAWLAIAGVLTVVAIFLASILLVDHFRERALLNSERELSSTVVMLARHFDQQFADSEIIATDLINRIGAQATASPESFRTEISKVATRKAIRSQGISYVGDISLFDAKGDMLSWSRDDDVPRLSIAGRSYFTRLSGGPEAPATITETVSSLLTGKLHTVVAHRIQGSAGAFVGVMVRRFDLAQFERFFASIAPGEEMALSLFQVDGTLLARYPQVPIQEGRRILSAHTVSQLSSGEPWGGIRGKSPIDGKERLLAGTKLANFPAILVASNTVEAALADWKSQTHSTFLVAAAAALAVATGLSIAIKQIMRDSRRNEQRLEAERERLDTALNNMVLGLVVYDAAGRVVSINRSYLEMFDFPRGGSVLGWTFHDLIRERQRRGHFDGSVDEFCSTVLIAMASKRIERTPSSTPDGRTFVAVNRPLSNGGWVATIEDTSERTRLEHERDRNLAFVHEIIDNIPSLIVVKDAKTRQYLLANQNVERYFGVPNDLIIGRTVFDFLPEKEARAVTRDDERLIKSATNILRSEQTSDFSGATGRHLKSTRISIRDLDGSARYIIGVLEDVTERKLANDRIAHLAHYDALTDLPNRVLFRTRMEALWSDSAERQFALLYIDIDGFKDINDSLGHDVGDRLLQQIAARLRSCLGPEDLIARLGGDEFAVVKSPAGSTKEIVDFVSAIHGPSDSRSTRRATASQPTQVSGSRSRPAWRRTWTNLLGTPIWQCTRPSLTAVGPIDFSS